MCNTEEWIVLTGYSRYFISNRGTIKKITKTKGGNGLGFIEKTLKTRIINGYLACTLIHDNGAKKTVYVHHAIATCFISKPKSKHKLIVVHNDGNKTNNAIGNLVWKSFSDFMKKEFETGRRSNKDLWSKRIKKHGKKGGLTTPGKRVKISLEKRKDIYILYHNKHFTLKKLALKYNCSISHIYNLLQKHKSVTEIGN